MKVSHYMRKHLGDSTFEAFVDAQGRLHILERVDNDQSETVFDREATTRIEEAYLHAEMIDREQIAQCGQGDAV